VSDWRWLTATYPPHGGATQKMKRRQFLDSMLAVVSIQIMCTFLIWCRIIDIVIQEFSTADLVVTLALCVVGAMHTILALYYFPQFHTHTAHTQLVQAHHPFAHADYLHPEASAAFEWKMHQLRTRQASGTTAPTAATTPSETRDDLRVATTPPPPPSAIMPQMVDAVSEKVDDGTGARQIHSAFASPIPSSTFARQSRQIDGLELLQGSHTRNLPILRNPALLGLLMTPDDVMHMETNRWCCFRVRLRDVTDEQERQWIEQYTRKNFGMFFLMLLIDSLTHPTSMLLVLVALTNILRLYALWILLPPSHDAHIDNSDPDDDEHEDDDEWIDVSTWWIDSPHIAFDVMWTVVAFIFVNYALYPQHPPIVVSVQVALAAAIATRHTNCFAALVLWFVGIVAVTAWGTSLLLAAASFTTTACLHAIIVCCAVER